MLQNISYFTVFYICSICKEKHTKRDLLDLGRHGLPVLFLSLQSQLQIFVGTDDPMTRCTKS